MRYEILMLLKNGKMKRKDETRISRSDIDQSEYFLIDTLSSEDDVSRNFVVVKPTEFLLFSNATVTYQMTSSTYDGDMGTFYSTELRPVEVTTESMSEMINLINCVNRVDLFNQMIADDMCGCDEQTVGMNYFGLKIQRNGQNIYDRYYSTKEPWKFGEADHVLKEFVDIYDSRIMFRMAKDKKRFFICGKEWSEVPLKRSTMIGLPLLYSNTMTFCTKIEYNTILERYLSITLTYSVHEDNEELHKYVTESVIGNSNYILMEGSNLSYFVVSTHPFDIHSTGPFRFEAIDTLSHVSFIIRLSNLLFKEIYTYDSISYESDRAPDTIVSFDFEYQPNRYLTLYLNEDTLLTIREIFSLLIE